MARSLPIIQWPHGAQVAVSLTFDVDADSSQLRHGPEVRSRLTTISAARYGPTRGLPRILDLLKAEDITATFYVPGDTAERYTGEVMRIVADGHEIGHHGYLHLHDDQMDPTGQRTEIERGLAALQTNLGITPRGYRSPGWELTDVAFGLIVELGFAYDSSCMGDDRPYLEENDGRSILELPVHWSLDDVPYYAWSREQGGQMCDPSTLFSTWLAEFDSAVREQRHVTFTMHPEFMGRGYRADGLSKLISEMRKRADVWFASHSAVAEWVVGEASSNDK